MIELKGDIGELDYGGITLNTADKLVQTIAHDIVRPGVIDNINRLTGETQYSVVAERVGFIHRGTLSPTHSVNTEIEHNMMLEFGQGGKNSYMRRTARSRKTKAAIRTAVKRELGEDLTAQTRSYKKTKRWRPIPRRRKRS